MFALYLALISLPTDCVARTLPLARGVHSNAFKGRKTVTVHNCDSAAEAMAAAESRHSGWSAIDARNVAGRVWQVTMTQD
jgi:hypothetical protein